MLSKNAKKIFKLAKKSKDYKISYIELHKALGWDFDQIHSACDQLIATDLVKEKRGIVLANKPNASTPWGIVLSEKGRHRWKYMAEDACMFILKSIIVPVIVSVLTTLATLLLSGFFGG